ncbi:MAG: NADH-quinone oxidoreductase subunit L [Candidatus Zeuxoniibacter abyssi]|nr:MAG: NADH-quinone oxidoreductase subunit L [Candidatus Persebacteraceae bacterium AB1(2)]
MLALILSVPLMPLVGALVAGLLGSRIGRRGAHRVAIAAVGWSFIALCLIATWVIGDGEVINFNWYVWARIGDATLSIGFLLDSLSVLMMLVVSFVSLMVHIYTIGYMAHDPGYCRFFSYISLFTFSMLMLVMANNFLQLFFGWEAVGLVSYLLIGFWFKRPTATYANLKAFLVNRVGDLGFLLGIGLVFAVFGTLDYAQVFADAPAATNTVLPSLPAGWDLMTAICLLLFVGAMGKSAQFPLHVWLPDSMEGPTPISALIHAATMVTAGIFMVARMSPLFELSATALTVVLAVGAITAFFMGLLGLVQNDIKRVIAYSTLSQLGYMTAALGASAYSAAMFHLFTHAFFKALLFLAAGSVIIAMHHEQDMRKMGGLRRYMPVTYVTVILGSLALAGVPPFAGFYSKDVIIEAVGASALPGATLAHWALVIGAFITALYSFRLLMLTFHGPCRMDEHTREALRKSPSTVTVPLVLLAVPSVFAGFLLVTPMLGGGFFDGAIFVAEGNDTTAAALAKMGGGALAMLTHSIYSPAFYCAVLGAVFALWLYSDWPRRTAAFADNPLHDILLAKYGFDTFNDWFFAGGARRLGGVLWKHIDASLIDGFFVNGTARLIGASSRVIRRLQSGAIYHYAFAMLFAVGLVLFWRLWLIK